MTTKPESTTEETWRSDKAHEAICEAAESIANQYCSEEDTYSLEVRRLTVAISDVVDQRNAPASTAPVVEIAHVCTNGVYRPYPAVLCSSCKYVTHGLSVKELCERLNAAATAAPQVDDCPKCGGSGEIEIGCAMDHALTASCVECGGTGHATAAPVEQSEHIEAIDCYAPYRTSASRSARAAAEEIDEATMDWALRELADGWIQNNEREGPHGFYHNARRVLNAIVNRT